MLPRAVPNGGREEDLADARGGQEAPAKGRDERAVWMAHAETSVASPVRGALWSDNQFHILEMQTGILRSTPGARCATIPLLMNNGQSHTSCVSSNMVGM